jgi:hypothetical protein
LLISSFHPSPTTRFEGYCFIGADYVAGARGAADYEATTSSLITPGHDGCYTVAVQRSYGWELGTDSHGMGKLYAYQNGRVWAVASSLYALVEHLRAYGVALKPSRHNLRALSVRTGLMQQPLSRYSIIQGVTLLSTHERVQITTAGIHKVKAAPPSETSYEEALAAYINTWRSRLMTIIEDDEFVLDADLSGGLDSRVVFSFLEAAGASALGHDRFKLVSNSKRTDDFAAARGVAEAYGFTLNTPSIPRRSAISPSNAINAWKETCLGTYLPLYLVNNDFEPRSIQAHGAGGENYRVFYPAEKGPGHLERFKKYFNAAELKSLQRQVNSELSRFAKNHPQTDPYISHYRQFRNRMHFGHRPHRRPMYTPLNSGLLDRVYDAPGASEDRQVYFDIMENLTPGLKDLPFDKPMKAPSEANNANVTRVDLDTTLSRGRVFADPLPEPVEDRAKSTAYKLWIEEAGNAVQVPEVREFMGEVNLKNAENGLAEYREKNKSLGPNHRGIQDLAYAMSVRFALDV